MSVVDWGSGEALTEPVRVACDGDDRAYTLPLRIPGGVLARNVVLRFRCCGQDRDGEADRIWLRCE